jgi:3-oxoadipate enol-lactonase
MTVQVSDRFVDVNGVRLYVMDRGRGRALVFLHGLGWDHTLWRGVTQAFSDQYRVIAGDTRGHGRSTKPDGPYTIALFSADWFAALKNLRVHQACIIGFSQGGMIAQTLAVEHPEIVGALVLVSTSCRSDPAAYEALEARIRVARSEGPAAAARLAAQSVFSRGFMQARPDAVEEFVQWRAGMDQEALVHATRAGYGFDVSARLAAIQVPTLVMYGEEDVLTPPSVVTSVASHIPGAELLGVPGAGHMIPVEKAGEFELALDTFLKKHYAPSL